MHEGNQGMYHFASVIRERLCHKPLCIVEAHQYSWNFVEKWKVHLGGLKPCDSCLRIRINRTAVVLTVLK